MNMNVNGYFTRTIKAIIYLDYQTHQLYRGELAFDFRACVRGGGHDLSAAKMLYKWFVYNMLKNTKLMIGVTMQYLLLLCMACKVLR